MVDCGSAGCCNTWFGRFGTYRSSAAYQLKAYSMATSNLHCPSCGRSAATDPDDFQVVAYFGKAWCARCARIKRTKRGMALVEQPSPGLLTEGAIDDVLEAWQDCYDMKPKRRINKADAKGEIQRAWARWNGDKTASEAMHMFFVWLCRHRPYFLTFRSGRIKADPWQEIQSWLLEYERLSKSAE